MRSMGVLAALVILAWPTRRRWPALIVGAVAVVAIGLSRLYLGVHDRSDVRGAWAAALAGVVGLYLVLAAPRPRRRWRGARTDVGANARASAPIRAGDRP